MANGSSEPRIVEKLRKVLALTTSPVEGEAQAAMAHLQRLLQDHNLSIADLEQKGGKARPNVEQQGHDLGKAAFTWKLNLAEVMADHFFCHPIVNRTTKTVAFVGRPDNVESMQMLYGWVIEQIKQIATVERRNHFIRTNEHIDPLRWQVNFGLGAVERIRTRLHEIRKAQSSEVTALALSHRSEISDWLEQQGGYRIDGRQTAREKKWEEEWNRQRAEEARLLESDPEEYYRQFPWRRPKTDAELAAEAKEQEKRARREARNASRRTGRAPRYMSAEEEKRQNQGWEARKSGRSAADRVNLQPFIEGQTQKKEVKE